jgi:preprotein translocase subunit Sss1
MRTIRESPPLWVWLALGLMVLGIIGYGIAVFFTEYMLARS